MIHSHGISTGQPPASSERSPSEDDEKSVLLQRRKTRPTQDLTYLGTSELSSLYAAPGDRRPSTPSPLAPRDPQHLPAKLGPHPITAEGPLPLFFSHYLKPPVHFSDVTTIISFVSSTARRCRPHRFTCDVTLPLDVTFSLRICGVARSFHKPPAFGYDHRGASAFVPGSVQHNPQKKHVKKTTS